MAEGEVYYAEDGTASVVLEEQFDPGYEPTQKEMVDYADFIGIDSVKEAPLMWIAREALKAPLPAEWKPCKTDTGEVYYFNFKTGESIWEHPLDEHYKTKVAEERANFILTGKSVDPNENSKTKKAKKDKKKKDDGEKTIRVEKGSAGSSEPSSAMGVKFEETKKKTATLELKPKVGRLGALGGDPSVEGSASGRGAQPDVSDLLAANKEEEAMSPVVNLLSAGSKPMPASASTGILGGTGFAATLGVGGIPGQAKAVGVGEAEEKQLRETLQAETDQELAELAAKHKKQLDNLEDELVEKRKQVDREVQAQSEVAVEQAKRSSSSRYARELTTLRNNLDDESASVRREVRELTEKLDGEKTAADRRVQRAIDDVKMDMDRYVAKESTKQRAELQDAWMAEKTKVELNTTETLRDLEAEHAATLERVSARLGPNGTAAGQAELSEQLTQLEQQLNAEYSQLEMDLAADTRNKVLAVHAKNEEEGNARNQEAQAIETQHHEAIQAERVKHQNDVAALQTAGQGKLTTLKQQHEAAKLQVSMEVQKHHESQSNAKAAADAAARAAMEEEIRAEEAKLRAEYQAKLDEMDRETDRQVHDARQRVLQASNDSNARELAAKEQDLQSQHAATMSAADRQFAVDKSTLESRLHADYEQKRSAVRVKQQERAKQQGNAKLVQEMAAVDKVRVELEAKFTTLKAELSSQNLAKLSVQKSKATAACEERIQTYDEEVKTRKAPDSPLRRSRLIESEEQKMEAELSAARKALEDRLKKTKDEVAAVEEDRALAFARHKVEELKSQQKLKKQRQQALEDDEAEYKRKQQLRLQKEREEEEEFQHKQRQIRLQRERDADSSGGAENLRRQRQKAIDDEEAEYQRKQQERSRLEREEEEEFQRKQRQIRLRREQEESDRVEADRRRRLLREEQERASAQSSLPVGSKEGSPLGRPPLSAAQHPGSVPTPTFTATDDNYTMSRPATTASSIMMTDIPSMRPTSSMSGGSGAMQQPQQRGAPVYASREGSAISHHYELDSRQSAMMTDIRQPYFDGPVGHPGASPARLGQPSQDFYHGTAGQGLPHGAVSRDRFEQEQQEAERLRKTLVSVRERDRKFAERVQRANEIIARKKQSIRDRQAEIKLAREDWHRDMALAKTNQDTAQQSILYKVKRNLEDQAKECNQEAVEVRNAMQWVKDEQKARTDRVNRKLDATLSPRRDRSPERKHRSSKGAVASTSQSKDELVALVHTMAERMAKVEDALLKATYPRPNNKSSTTTPQKSARGTNHGKNGGSTALFKDPMEEGGALVSGTAGGQEMKSKWGKWLGGPGSTGQQQQQQGSAEGGGALQQATGGPQKMSEVEQWVADTLQSPRR